MHRPALLRIVAVFLGLCSLFTTTSHAQVVTAGSPQTILTPADTDKIGILGWPDSNLAFFFWDGAYYIFASNANSGETQVLRSTDLGALRTNRRIIKTKALRQGGGGAFDRDYAGGGSVYYDTASGFLIQLYHGEYWYGGGEVNWLPAYSSLGLAVSEDLGKTWRKLGEVISAAAPRANKCQADIGNGSLIPRPDGFLYVYYSDLEPPCDHGAIGLARARISDIVDAAKAKKKLKGSSGSLFMKYFNGSFSQPGVVDLTHPSMGGGSFTPMFAHSEDGSPTMSSVAFDDAINEYVMTYVAGWQGNSESGIAFRVSPDGIHWSDATILNLGRTAFYPSLVNAAGGDPNTLKSQFFLYYVEPFPGPSTLNLKRVSIRLNGTPITSSPQ